MEVFNLHGHFSVGIHPHAGCKEIKKPESTSDSGFFVTECLGWSIMHYEVIIFIDHPHRLLPVPF